MGLFDALATPDFKSLLSSLPSFALGLGHEYILPEHLLAKLIENKRILALLEAIGCDVAGLKRDLEAFFDEKLERIEGLRQVGQSISLGRVLGAVEYKAVSAQKKEIDVVDLLVALFEEERSHAVHFLLKRGVDQFAVITEISSVDYSPSGFAEAEAAIGKLASSGDGSDEFKELKFLPKFAVELTAQAKAGKIDRIIGRTSELSRMMRTLCRRKKNNPLLVGESGVGKTAVAEGLAYLVAKGEVPAKLREIKIWSLDMGSLVAGTKYRGDFEERLKNLVKEVKENPSFILFIDEIHTVVGAGATGSGSMDASNILKPALNSGAVRCIGSTTYEEYRNHILKDRAFSRRLQKIDIAEPSAEDAVKILEGIAPYYEEHYGASYAKDALARAVELSVRHINDRFLPDKAIDIIDEAGARLTLQAAKTEKSAGGRKPKIDVAEIDALVSEMTKIPVAKLSGAETESLRGLEDSLKGVVIGQDEAVDAVVKAIKVSKAGIGDKSRPIGCFLFAGPTGVGKTELAKQLAAKLGIDFIRFDMSEYSEEYSVSKLIGSSPGYVGFEQGGLLTEQLVKKPHSVVLLDEVEKAHRRIYDLLLQVMDYGSLSDNTGRKADFRNAILIMTSNVGAKALSEKPIGFNPGDDTGGRTEDAVKKHFSPEFRNRLDATVHFNPLPKDVIERIVDKFVGLAAAELAPRSVSIELDGAARAWFAKHGFDEKLGARPLARLVRKEIVEGVVDDLLFGKLSKKGGRVKVSAKDDAIKLEIKAKKTGV